MQSKPDQDDDLLPEYDFSKMKQAKPRGYYADRIRHEGMVVSVMLDPDVHQAFPTSEAVNAALRGLMQQNAESRPAE